MALEPGQDLLHYRLVVQIGEGGMGVVWKAVDTTLDREVAIKVLPPAFADDADRLARFQREAKVVASLAHPNIAPIYGLHEVGTSTGSLRFLAMELVPGEDLSQRLQQGPLPLFEAIEIAQQIAAALESAHDNGVVHRDLKPANVRVGPDGRARVLDFGLAKAVESSPVSGHSPTLSPTMTSAGTVAGIILGTAAYMSPEQARGKPVDRQTDVWAFGCVLFELLTGRSCFHGETVTDILGAIVHREPDWNLLPSIPPGVERTLRSCIRKDPRERLRNMGDVGLMLRDGMAEAPVTVDAGEGKRRGNRLWPMLAGVSTLALVAVLASSWLRSPQTGDTGGDVPRVVGMIQLTDLPGEQRSPSLSSDGEQLLYVAEDGGDEDIFLQRVGGEKPVNLTEDFPDDDFQPAFSPDRRSIAFGSRREGGGIFVMGATGESPRQVSDTGFDAAWSPDGTKLVYTTERITNPYSRTAPATLWIVDLETLEREQLHSIDAAGANWSPGGGRIAFWTHYATVKGQRDIWTIPAEGGEPVQVTSDVHTDWDPIWSPDGRWLHFVSDRGGSPDLWRVRIDERSGRVQGEPQPVTVGIANVTEATMSADGRQIALTVARETGSLQVLEFDPAKEQPIGEPVTIHSSSSNFVQMDLSGDGEWITYRTTAPRETIYVMRVDGTARRKVVDDAHRNRGPRWSPDGEWIAFYSNRSGTYQVWAIRPNGTDLRQLTDDPEVDAEGPTWWPDGSRIMVSMLTKEIYAPAFLELSSDDLATLNGTVAPQPISNGQKLAPSRISPDGRFFSGTVIESQGELAFALYDFDSEEREVPRREDGRLFRVWERSSWLGEHRIFFWEKELDSTVVWDTKLNGSRLLPEVPGPAEYDFTNDGSTLIINLTVAESDIWLLTIDE